MSRNSSPLRRSGSKRKTLRDKACRFVSAQAGPRADDKGSPRENHTVTPIMGTANEALAANLCIAFPKTPQRATPNSTKKRRQIPDLSRSTPTSSHGTKVSMIFRDAAATLQDIRTPQPRPSSNTKKTRLPISQARTCKFGSTSGDIIAVSTDRVTSSWRYQASQPPLGTRPELRAIRTGQEFLTPTATPSANNALNGLPEEHQPYLPILPGLATATPLLVTANVSPRSPRDVMGKEPISSGFATPSALYSQPARTPEEILCPELKQWQLPWSSSISGSDSGEYLLNRKCPLSLPTSSSNNAEHKVDKIEEWLNDICTLINTDDSDPRIIQQPSTGMHQLSASTVPVTPGAAAHLTKGKAARFVTPNPKEGLRGTFSTSSNKENVSPPKSTSSPTSLLVQHSAKPFLRSGGPKLDMTTQSTGAMHSAHPLTPQGHLSLPPKRKKVRVRLDEKTEPPRSGGKDFTIHDEQVADALAQLSPDVELCRKGRRPKRERCVSYWDEDILPPDSPSLPVDVDEKTAPVRKGRKVLGESQQTVELTKAKPFAKEAGNAAFDFRLL